MEEGVVAELQGQGVLIHYRLRDWEGLVAEEMAVEEMELHLRVAAQWAPQIQEVVEAVAQTMAVGLDQARVVERALR